MAILLGQLRLYSALLYKRGTKPAFEEEGKKLQKLPCELPVLNLDVSVRANVCEPSYILGVWEVA